MNARTAITALVVAALVVGSGCQQQRRTRARSDVGRNTPAVARDQVVRSEQRATPARREQPQGGMNSTSMAFPTGDERTSAILLTQVAPREVRAGEPYEWQIQVKNLTDATLQNVVVATEHMQNLQIVAASPNADRGPNGGPAWLLGDLAPGATQAITVRSAAETLGTASNCLSVTYNNALCAQVAVVQPAIELVMSGPPEAILCDVITYRVEVRNTGTGNAQGVRVRQQLPEGLQTTDGRNTVEIDVGSLAAGEARAFDIATRATRPGAYRSGAAAVSAHGLTAESRPVETVVRAPVLEVASDCAETVFVGRNMAYRFRIRNTGDAPAANAVFSVGTPRDAAFVSASENGSAAASSVNWDLGVIRPGEERIVTVTYRPNAIGDYQVAGVVNAACAPEVRTACSASVRGIPALLVEVVDTDDPIEVGGETTYLIGVTNQGSAPDTNVRLVCVLPPEQAFVSAVGATPGQADGSRVQFAPLPTLAPGAKATWRVTVRATREGNIRYHTIVTSDNFEQPIEELEATFLYR